MIGLDTWFFFQLKDRNQKAIDFWKSIIRGKQRIMISAIVLYELGINMYSKGESKFYEEVKRIVTKTQNIHIANINLDVIDEAIRLKHSFGSPTLDALIVATYRVGKCLEIVTEDKDIINLAKKGLIKTNKDIVVFLYLLSNPLFNILNFF
jgi:predicted nucleic acid-binding protein